MLSYYTDDGPVVACEPEVIIELWGDHACDGHFGDSEAIILDVYYQVDWQHWVLDRAAYSVHETYNGYWRVLSQTHPPALKYPDRAGGYPRAFVAYSKHANYSSDKECDNGGIFGSDNCLPDAYERVAAGAQLNMGSRTHHGPNQDCVHSGNPIMDPEVVECYWTEKRFGGWNTGLPNAGSYQSRLDDRGF